MASPGDEATIRWLERTLPVPDGRAPALFVLPPQPHAVVVFAVGPGSAVRSPRNEHLAGRLAERGYAPVLPALVPPAAARLHAADVDVEGWRRRLAGVVDAVMANEELAGLPLALYAAGFATAPALLLAEQRDGIAALVLRHARPELVRGHLPHVVTPTLYVVGGRDPAARATAVETVAQMHVEAWTVVVPGATALFEEEGVLDALADAVIEWLDEHLLRRRRGAA